MRSSVTDSKAGTVPDGGVALLLKSPRDRWTSTLAKRCTSIHLLVGLVVIGWLYFIAPLAKQRIDDGFGTPTPVVIATIRESDLIVNYWYLLVFVGPVVLVMDFRIIRWIGKQLGPPYIVRFGCSMTLLLLMAFAFRQYVLS